jgi:hypothetical protein
MAHNGCQNPIPSRLSLVMTWLSYGVSLLLLALVIGEYCLAHVAYDRRTTAHKRTRTIVFTMALVSIVAQQVIAKVEDRSRSKGEAELRAKVDSANTNIGKLLSHQSELLAALGTNSSIPAKLRVEILDHTRAVELVSADVSELEQWKTDFKNEQAAAKQKEDVAKLKHQISVAEQGAAAQGRVDQTWKRATQFYDFIIRTLQETVQGIAKGKGDKVFSDYAGLPPLPMGDKGAHIANITTGTNLGWFFKVSAEGISRPSGAEVWLRVYGSCTNRAERVIYQTVVNSSENVESHLMLTPTHAAFSQTFSLEAYQTNAIAWVRRFIAAHAIRCDSR